jgi:molecular chaperone DnaJ
MAKQDYYKVLGVEKNASQDEIKKAYRKLAMKFHPDRNQGDKTAEHKFKELNEAYEALKDEQKRAAYDRYGHDAFDGTGRTNQNPFGSGGGAPGGFNFNGDFSDLSDIFGGIFGDFVNTGGQRRQAHSGVNRGSDLRYNLNIDLETAYNGGKQEIAFRTHAKCDACHGSGSKSGKTVSCKTCHGQGTIRAQQGFFIVERTCHSCHGSGSMLTDPCGKCAGQGRISQNKTLNINIPAGIDNNTKIRIAGEGEAGLKGGENGDLYVFISVKPHKIFNREGANLYCTIPIKMTTAALGGSISVPGLDGKYENLNIPTGTQEGTNFVIKGKGMPVMKSSRFGDTIVTVNIEIPQNLTKRQKELLQEFDDICTSKTNPKTESFFSKVKSFFDDLKK